MKHTYRLFVWIQTRVPRSPLTRRAPARPHPGERRATRQCQGAVPHLEALPVQGPAQGFIYPISQYCCCVSRDSVGISILGYTNISSNSKTYEMRVRVHIPWDLPHIWNPKSIFLNRLLPHHVQRGFLGLPRTSLARAGAGPCRARLPHPLWAELRRALLPACTAPGLAQHRTPFSRP